MSENQFVGDDFNFDDIEPKHTDLKTEPVPVQESKIQETKIQETKVPKPDTFDEDFAPISGLDALDNVNIEIPTEVPIPIKTSEDLSNVSKHQKDVLTEMLSGDAMDQAEIQNLMSDRRALYKRLQEDPGFDKRYKRAEKEYFDRVNGVKSDPDPSVPNDEVFKQAQALVEQLHNKAPIKPDDSDPHGLSRFGDVLDDVPDDLPEPAPKEQKPKPKSNDSERNIVVIKKVKKLVININF
jgi:hypothetical protein